MSVGPTCRLSYSQPSHALLEQGNIVRFIEYLETSETLYIIMELIRGRTIRQLVLEDSPIQVQQIKIILKQMVSFVQLLIANECLTLAPTDISDLGINCLLDSSVP